VDAASSPSKNFLERNWLNLSKFDWIWEKIGKIKAKFEQEG